MKLKKLLETTLGELPSSKLKKMKWNPVTQKKPTVNEGKKITDKIWDKLPDNDQHKALVIIRNKKIADRFWGDNWKYLPQFIQRDLKTVDLDELKESIVNEAYDLKRVLIKHENDIFSAMVKYRRELPDDANKSFRNLRDAFFKGLDSIVKKHNLYDQ